MRKGHKKSIYEALGRNPVHPFPARMAPGIALNVVAQPAKKLRILDPMMGSGTVIALARANGHRTVGIDIDPLAVLISKTWTTSVDSESVRKKGTEVLARAHKIFESLPLAEAYPKNADSETRKFIRYWFDAYARRQLAALAVSIKRVHNKKVRAVLWCAFSRLIISKQAGVSLAKDLAHSRPHKSYDTAPIKPLSNFLVALERVLENCVTVSDIDRGPKPSLHIGDARRLKIADCSIDLVLTSPPYLNAIDYMRCSKFSLVWMGYSSRRIRTLRGESVGTEIGEYRENEFAISVIKRLKIGSRLPERHRALLVRFIDDMDLALHEVSRVLVPGGKAIYVVGENTIKGAYIRNSRIVALVAKRAGLLLQQQTTRSLPPNRRYLPPPSNRKRQAALDSRMRREVVLQFKKPNVRRVGKQT